MGIKFQFIAFLRGELFSRVFKISLYSFYWEKFSFSEERAADKRGLR